MPHGGGKRLDVNSESYRTIVQWISHGMVYAKDADPKLLSIEVSALIEDIYARGLDKRVLVVVTGEFGRTPKINFDRSTGGGDASGPA